MSCLDNTVKREQSQQISCLLKGSPLN